MNAVKKVFKVIWWIVRIPILPIILGWRWTRRFAKGEGMLMSYKVGSQRVTFTIAPWFIRFVYFLNLTWIMYALCFVAVSGAYRFFVGEKNSKVAPATEQVVEQTSGVAKEV